MFQQSRAGSRNVRTEQKRELADFKALLVSIRKPFGFETTDDAIRHVLRREACIPWPVGSTAGSHDEPAQIELDSYLHDFIRNEWMLYAATHEASPLKLSASGQKQQFRSWEREDVRQHLLELMKQHHLSRLKVSAILREKKSLVADWCRGRRGMPRVTLELLQERLRLTPAARQSVAVPTNEQQPPEVVDVDVPSHLLAVLKPDMHELPSLPAGLNQPASPLVPPPRPLHRKRRREPSDSDSDADFVLSPQLPTPVPPAPLVAIKAAADDSDEEWGMLTQATMTQIPASQTVEPDAATDAVNEPELTDADLAWSLPGLNEEARLRIEQLASFVIPALVRQTLDIRHEHALAALNPQSPSRHMFGKGKDDQAVLYAAQEMGIPQAVLKNAAARLNGKYVRIKHRYPWRVNVKLVAQRARRFEISQRFRDHNTWNVPLEDDNAVFEDTDTDFFAKRVEQSVV
eukprot:TRINITY_DN3945_c0_g1_i1.p1 TRINITY_DN3945_c0_g1~~TRINITY_DN3945_c0_g1_i1.p1  ORF type:complete len:461 (-),score=81.31 TRINITY_DN3945_c0_g1_i1:1218-2600(-)